MEAARLKKSSSQCVVRKIGKISIIALFPVKKELEQLLR
jgi:hypothetical protein